MIDRRSLKLSVMIQFAQSIKSLSTCKRLNVGCVIIPSDFSNVLAIGYNGVPSGLSNESCNGEKGACGCIHAEMNALTKLNTYLDDLTLITTFSPCSLCAGLIINSGLVARVVYCEDYRDTTPLSLLSKAGIVCLKHSQTVAR